MFLGVISIYLTKEKKMVAENEDMRALDGTLTPEERLDELFAEDMDLYGEED